MILHVHFLQHSPLNQGGKTVAHEVPGLRMLKKPLKHWDLVQHPLLYCDTRKKTLSRWLHPSVLADRENAGDGVIPYVVVEIEKDVCIRVVGPYFITVEH